MIKRAIPYSGKVRRIPLASQPHVLASEMCDIHEIHIRDHDFGKMQKNAKIM